VSVYASFAVGLLLCMLHACITEMHEWAGHVTSSCLQHATECHVQCGMECDEQMPPWHSMINVLAHQHW
jgi:hypothetical protein